MKSLGVALEAAAFAAGSRAPLMRTGVLLTGGRHSAEDLVQTALVRVYPNWGLLESWDSPVAYARKAVVNLYASWRRRSWHGEVPHVAPADDASGSGLDRADRVVARHEIVDALAALPRHPRAVLVLRYFEDMSVEEAAEALGSWAGTVKLRTHWALQRLRATQAWHHELEGSAP